MTISAELRRQLASGSCYGAAGGNRRDSTYPQGSAEVCHGWSPSWTEGTLSQWRNQDLISGGGGGAELWERAPRYYGPPFLLKSNRNSCERGPLASSDIYLKERAPTEDVSVKTAHSKKKLFLKRALSH